MKYDKTDTKGRFVSGIQMLPWARGVCVLEKWGPRTLAGPTPHRVLGGSETQSLENGPDGPRWRARPLGGQMRGTVCLEAAQWEAEGEQTREESPGSPAQWLGWETLIQGLQRSLLRPWCRAQSPTSTPRSLAFGPAPTHLESLVDVCIIIHHLSFPWFSLGALQDETNAISTQSLGQRGPDNC